MGGYVEYALAIRVENHIIHLKQDNLVITQSDHY